MPTCGEQADVCVSHDCSPRTLAIATLRESDFERATVNTGVRRTCATARPMQVCTHTSSMLCDMSLI